MEISRTARNLPQLFRCSFSSRKKFQTNRLQDGQISESGRNTFKVYLFISEQKLFVTWKLRAERLSKSLDRSKCIYSRRGCSWRSRKISAKDLRSWRSSKIPRSRKNQFQATLKIECALGQVFSYLMIEKKYIYSGRINDFFAQKFVFSSTTVQKSPIHFDIPSIGIDGINDTADDPQPQPGTFPVIRSEFRFVILLESCSYNDQKSGRVFSGVGEMRKSFFRVFVPSETLSKPEPGW